MDRKNIFTYQEHVREAIKRSIYLEMSKDDFLELLDKSVYDESAKKQLTKIVKETIKKW